MQEIPLDQIIVNEGRFRRTFNNVETLAESIKSLGLIQPIVIGEDFHLIAGERRYRAHKLLGLQTIKCVYMKDLAEYERAIVELEENVRRENLTWQEECVAKYKIHTLYQKRETLPQAGVPGGWRIQDTAEALGESYGKVSQDLTIGKAILEKENNHKGDSLNEMPTKSSALKALKTRDDNAIRAVFAQALQSKLPASEFIKIYNEDCLVGLAKVPNETIDCVITDPPWGLGVDESEVGNSSLSIDKEINLEFLKPIAVELFRVLTIDSHCYIFMGMKRYANLVSIMQAVGFNVDPIPLIWAKGTAYNPSPFYRFTADYEIILFCKKGSRRLNYVRGSILNVPAVKGPDKEIIAEKPVMLLEELIDLSTVEGELVLDPFGGSGSTMLAAKRKKRRGLSYEIEKANFDLMVTRLSV